MSLRKIIGEYALIAKVNVKDLDKSRTWYEEKLHLINQPGFEVPGWWNQLRIPHLPGTAVGLNKSDNVGTGGAITTFVVHHIEAARDALIANGVSVDPIQTLPLGVKMATFQDPDGNRLGLRQNAPTHPPISAMFNPEKDDE